MEFKSFLQALSSVEKRYGRSIIDIRRQLHTWEEMLLEQEIFVPEQVLAVEQTRFTATYVSFPVFEEFSGVFDLMKSISRFLRWRISAGIDLSRVNFSRTQWRSFLLLLKATVGDWTRIWISLDIDSLSYREFMLAVASFSELRFLGLNLFVSERILACFREGKGFELAGEDLTEVYSLQIPEFSQWMFRLREKGVRVRIVVDSPAYREEVLSLGPRKVVCDGGNLLIPGEAVPEVRLNLVRFIKRKGNVVSLDWERLGDRIQASVRMLDDLIDLCDHPVREIYEITRRLRRVNLAIDGWARLLCYLGIPYDSDSAVELAERLSDFLREQTDSASWLLARERGVFPSYRGSRLEREGIKRRNVSVLSGTGGIGPLLSLWEDKGPISLLDEIAHQRNFFSESLLERMHSGLSIRGLRTVPEDVQKIFVLDQDISPEWKMKHQSAFQGSWDGLVEVGLANVPVREAVVKVSLFGGLCGIFEELNGQTSSFESEEQESSCLQEKSSVFSPSWKDLSTKPEVLFGQTVRVQCACGPLVVTVNQDEEGRIREVLLRMEKSGGCISSHLDALGRMLSLLFSAGVDPEVVIKELEGINCSSVGWHKGRRIYSCADAVSYVLREMMNRTKNKEGSREVLMDESIIDGSKEGWT